MRQCPNCGSQITCGCQDRVAFNGTQCCSSCIKSYEDNLRIIAESQTTNLAITQITLTPTQNNEEFISQ